MSKQESTLHPLKAKVFAKGQALREARPLLDAIIDLKTKTEKIAEEANMDFSELWDWLVSQLEINDVPREDDYYEEDEEAGPVSDEEGGEG